MIAGRGTGKTSRKAWRYRQIVREMPRSCNAIYTRTFKSLLTNTISPVLGALASMGIHRDVHYVIGQKPPASWDIAPNAPSRYDYYMSFRNGTGWRFMSEDREESFRGPSVDSVDADEGLLLDRTKFENGPIAANRGNLAKYKHSSLHHSISIDSSMPFSGKGQWILGFGDYYKKDGNDYWKIWNKVVSLQYKFLKSNSPKERIELMNEWIALRKQIRFYKTIVDNRGTSQLFTFFNVFDNIKNVGIKYIEDAMRVMTPISFCIEMLNQLITAVEDGFYNIRDDIHLYDSWDYSFIDSLDYNFPLITGGDSRHDRDVDKNKPLDLGIDFGHHINAMRIGQEHKSRLDGLIGWEYRFVKSMLVLAPQGHKELVAKFSDYYRYHKEKRVILWHDHTSKGGEGWRLAHISETESALKASGWEVEVRYIGKAPDHKVKHLLWYLCLLENDPRFPSVRFNRTNDKEGIMSMQMAPVKQGRNGIEKDKSSEKSKTIPREQATDLSDAGDLILFGRYGHLLQDSIQFTGLF
jgi:hypothetical protein